MAHVNGRFVSRLNEGGVLWSAFLRCWMMVYDKTRAPLAGDESPRPLHENGYSQVGCGKKLDVNPCPREPGQGSAEMDFAALQNCKTFADHCHIALVEIAERTQSGFPRESLLNHPARISSLLHCNLGDTRQRLPVLLE